MPTLMQPAPNHAPSPTASATPCNRPAVAALAAVLATSAAVSLVTLNGLKDAVIAASLNNRPITPNLFLRATGPLDLLLILLAVAAVLAAAWLQLRRHAFTRLLATMTPAEFWTLGALLIAWLGHCYLGAGILLGGDMATHIARFLEVARGLDEGHLADWTNYQYIGAPLLWFTGPLTYVVGGVLTWFTRDAVWTMKLLLFALHLLGGLAFMGLLRRWAFRPVPALIAAAGFAGSFAHLHMFLYRGVMPQAFTMLFMVGVFWAADGLLRGIGRRSINALVFALATTALIVNHQPHALFIGAYLALFGLVLLLTGVWSWRGVPLLAAAGLLAAVASTLAVVPILAEADSTMIVPEGGLFRLQIPTPDRLWNLVRWRNSVTVLGFDYWAYLGLGLIVFGATALAALATRTLPRPRQALALAAAACLLLEFFLYNSVVRDVMFMLFFLAILAAIGLEWLTAPRPQGAHSTQPRLTGPWLLAATALALLDLASTSVQPVLRTDKGFLLDAGRYLEQTAPNQRVVQIAVAPDGTLDVDMGPKGTALAYAATVQRVAGNHNMAATRAHNFIGATLKQVQATLQHDGTIPPPLRAMLGLYNVTRVICATATANGCPASFHDTAEDPVLGRYIPIPASPALFSPNLVEAPLPPGVDKPMLWPVYYEWPWRREFIARIDATLQRYLETARPDPAHSIAATIPIQQPLPPGAPPANPAPITAPTIRTYTVTLDSILLSLDSNQAGWLQLAHPWFPSTSVTVNGRPIQPLRGTLGLIVLPIQPGANTITLHEGATPIRRLSMAVSALGLLAILLAAAALAWHDRRRPPQYKSPLESLANPLG